MFDIYIEKYMRVMKHIGNVAQFVEKWMGGMKCGGNMATWEDGKVVGENLRERDMCHPHMCKWDSFTKRPPTHKIT